MNTRSFIYSALIAGVLIGIFGNLPLLNLINCILCVWVWLGGILAVYLYGRFQRGEPGLTVGQAAGLGAVAGAIGAFVGVVVYALTSFISAPMIASLARLLQVEGNIPTGPSIAGTLVFFFIDIVLYPIFGAVGGVIAASLIWKKPQALSQ